MADDAQKVEPGHKPSDPTLRVQVQVPKYKVCPQDRKYDS